MRAPGGRSTVRLPSHHKTPAPWVCANTSTASSAGRSHDHRAREQRVGADRDDQKCFDARPHDGTTCAEVVGRRAGRGRAHDAVAPPARQRPSIDLHHHFEHPLAGGLLDARLVQREGGGDQLACRGAPRRRASADPRTRTAAWTMASMVDSRRRPARPPPGIRRVPRLTPQQRRTATRRDLAARRMCVAADHEGEFAVVAGASLSLISIQPAPARRLEIEVLGLRAPAADGDAVLVSARSLPGDLARLLRPGVGQQQHPACVVAARRRGVGHGPTFSLVPPSDAAALHLGPHVRRPIAAGPRAQPEEELDVARGPRQWAGRDRPAPQPHLLPRTRRPPTASARRPRSRTTPPLPTRSFPTSNCGLTISASSPSGAVTASSASRTSSAR